MYVLCLVLAMYPYLSKVRTRQKVTDVQTLHKMALIFSVDVSMGMSFAITARDTQQLLEIWGSVTSDRVPAWCCIPTGIRDEWCGKSGVDVTACTACGTTIDNVRQA